MKASISKLLLLVLAAASTATAAPTTTPAKTPEGYIVAYLLEQCAKASLPTGSGSVGEDVNGRTFTLPLGKCQDISPLFTSFVGGLVIPCPAGKSPTVTAYPEKGCKGANVVVITKFPPSGAQSECENIGADDSQVPPRVGGQSAIFRCAT